MVYLYAQNPIAVLKTSQGTIEIELLSKVAPLAVENFSTHIKNGYYDGIIFHRVIKNFMIQAGDPTGTGKGGKSIWGRDFKNEYAPNVVFDKAGIVAMANKGPNTNSSQFFITTVATPHLNGGYTIFGKVIKGYDIVQKIENIKTYGQKGWNKPIEDQKIIKATMK
jgi:peptidylprolyl isomerase